MPEVNVFDMSFDEFEKYEAGSQEVQVEEESTIVDSSNLETEDTSLDSEETEETTETVAVEDEEELLEQDEESGETDELDSDDETESEEGESNTDEVDYAAEYKKLIGTPIKANGKDITIDNVDDAVRLIQMGANYYKKVEQLKPAQKMIAMLEQHQLMDEEKLSFAIDLLNKNPQAINKLVAGMDLYELTDESKGDYKPTNHAVSDTQIALNDAIKEIQGTDTYERTVDLIGNKWDSASREIVQKNPSALTLINQHMASGIYDTVNTEVEKRKMLGTIPSGLSDIEAYKYVGDSLYAQAVPQSNPSAQTGQLPNGQKANVVPPIRKPSKDTVVKQKKSTSVPRGKASVTEQIDNIYAMSEADFNAKYGNHF